MNRRDSAIALLAIGAAPTLVFAQEPQKTARIGYLSAETESGMGNRLQAFRAGLRDLGYVEGRNLVIEVRRADGNYGRLPGLAAELVQLKVDLLLTEGVKAGIAAKQATSTIPIVVPATADPVGAGLASSLSHPGGNITATSAFGPELMAKRLDLLKEAVPRIRRIAFLMNPVNPDHPIILKALEAAAKSLKVDLQTFEVRATSELEGAFAAMAASHVDALVVQSDTMFDSNMEAIARLASARRLPSAGRLELAEAGGLIGYGVDSPGLYRQSAAIVVKILKGANPGDIPIERATLFELVVNRRAARSLRITVPRALIVRADRLIE